MSTMSKNVNNQIQNGPQLLKIGDVQSRFEIVPKREIIGIKLEDMAAIKMKNDVNNVIAKRLLEDHANRFHCGVSPSCIQTTLFRTLNFAEWLYNGILSQSTLQTIMPTMLHHTVTLMSYTFT